MLRCMWGGVNGGGTLIRRAMKTLSDGYIKKKKRKEILGSSSVMPHRKAVGLKHSRATDPFFLNAMICRSFNCEKISPSLSLVFVGQNELKDLPNHLLMV